jgi:uncharacterized DUF497 family protein
LVGRTSKPVTPRGGPFFPWFLTCWRKGGGFQCKTAIGFKEAATFEWDTAFVTRDFRTDYGEPRFTALGFIEARLCMIFTKRGDVVYIISLRKANARERRFYEES